MRKILLILLGAGILISAFSSKSPPAAPKAPEQPKSAEQLAADAAKEKRFRKTVLVAQTIKNSLRDPDSLKWSAILANDDGSVVCVEYRARNGFGGMNVEQASYSKGKLSTDPKPWNRYCAKQPLHNMAYVRNAVR
jgi:hypothetical protein